MKCTWLLYLVCLIVICEPTASAQSPVTLVAINKEPRGAFSFVKKWDYPWNVLKHNNGKFEKTDGGEIIAADTAHLYFTANCKTNVQGGYSIRYCYASKKGGKISLNFSDGLPAYASEFNVVLENNKFSFEPKIIYPELRTDKMTTYKMTRTLLVIYGKNYLVSKVISGYINAEFTETASNPANRPQIYKYYLRGYFKTVVN